MDQRNENRGRDQNIFNQPGTVVIHQAEQPSRSRVEQQLLQIVRQEVESRLRQSLHNAVLINLGKEAQPEQVKRPWDAEIKIGTRPAEPIPENTSILEVFDRSDVGGKLLILGNPGSGKTTTLLDLAKALIERAETDMTFPLPVLFNLSSWKDDQQTMPDWLVAELKSKYGVRQDIGKQWLQDRALLPLLDGLDEVKPERQEGCVNAINTWLTGEAAPLDVVVCSRREEYNAYAATLQLNGAIGLQALTLPQIQDYLAQVNRSELWELLDRDPELLELVQAPLFLSIVLLAYPKDSLENWRQLGSTQERLQDLWDRYICRMFERELRNNPYRKKEPSQQQTRRWLVWLAQQMQRESQTEFLIERMQPACLTANKQKRRYSYTFGVLFFLLSSAIAMVSIVVLLTGLTTGFYLRDGIISGFSGLLLGVLVSLIIGVFILVVGLLLSPFGVIFGLIVGYSNILNSIQPVEAVRLSLNHFSYQKFTEKFILLFRLGIFYNLTIYSIYIPLVVIVGLVQGWVKALNLLLSTGLVNLIYSLSLSLALGVSFGLIYGFQIEVQIRTKPNQGIRNSVRNTLFSGVISSFLLLAIVCIFSLVVNLDASNEILSSTSSTSKFFYLLWYCLIGIWPTVVMGAGGFVLAQHVALRWILVCNKYIPWNYARFLDYASERLLIQRVGGRYRFIHKLLQDHFAGMSLSPPFLECRRR